MSVRRLASAEVQPPSFAFSAENAVWAGHQIAKYPDGRQASGVIPLLWRAQEQAGGWVPQKAIEHVAEVLGMPYIRVLEIATFYTMFNLAPVGRHFIQLCGTTPCMLRGAHELKKALIERIGPEKTVSADGRFSWAEVECLGACCNAPMVQINSDFYEDLTPASLNTVLDEMAAGREVKPGPQQIKRVSSEPIGQQTSLTDSTLFDGSVVGAWRERFEQEKKARAEAAAAAEAAKAEAVEAPKAEAAKADAAKVEPAKAEPAKAAAAVSPAGSTATPALADREVGKPEATRPAQHKADSPADRAARGAKPTATAEPEKAHPATAAEQEARTDEKTSAVAPIIEQEPPPTTPRASGASVDTTSRGMTPPPSAAATDESAPLGAVPAAHVTESGTFAASTGKPRADAGEAFRGLVDQGAAPPIPNVPETSGSEGIRAAHEFGSPPGEGLRQPEMSLTGGAGGAMPDAQAGAAASGRGTDVAEPSAAYAAAWQPTFTSGASAFSATPNPRGEGRRAPSAAPLDVLMIGRKHHWEPTFTATAVDPSVSDIGEKPEG